MTATTTESTSSITSRLRHRLEDAQSRARAVPVSMRAAVDRMLERMREALDLPSRSELQELTQRLEELDRRIAALAVERVGEMSRVVPALAERNGDHDPIAVAVADTAPVADADTDTDPVADADIGTDTDTGNFAAADSAAEFVTPAEGECGAEVVADPAQPRAGKRNKRNGRHRKK